MATTCFFSALSLLSRALSKKARLSPLSCWAEILEPNLISSLSTVSKPGHNQIQPHIDSSACWCYNTLLHHRLLPEICDPCEKWVTETEDDQFSHGWDYLFLYRVHWLINLLETSLLLIDLPCRFSVSGSWQGNPLLWMHSHCFFSFLFTSIIIVEVRRWSPVRVG